MQAFKLVLLNDVSPRDSQDDKIFLNTLKLVQINIPMHISIKE